jgi:hypothetical protein
LGLLPRFLLMKSMTSLVLQQIVVVHDWNSKRSGCSEGQNTLGCFAAVAINVQMYLKFFTTHQGPR